MTKIDLQYVSVSTDTQTTTQQEEEVRRHIPKDAEVKVLTEIESAWDKDKGRKKYEEMKKMIANDEVGTVWAWAWDRLGRNYREIHKFLFLCEDHNVKDKLDSDAPYHHVQVAMMADMAEKESARRPERVKGKLSMLKEKHGYTMHGSPQGGFLRPSTLKQLPTIKGMLRVGLTANAIAKTLKIDVRTIRRIEKEPNKVWTDKKTLCKKLGKDWYLKPEDYGAAVHPRREKYAS